jgi:hypothetical protein
MPTQPGAVLTSSPFGLFDPFAPCDLPGRFARIIDAAPVEIDAKLEQVWKIMTGFDRYPEWNPMNRFFRLDAEARPGDTVTFGPVWGPYNLSEGAPLPEAGFTQNETLTVWEENCCLAYAVISRAFNAERVQHISRLENGKTRYHTFERTSGLLPLSHLRTDQRALEPRRPEALRAAHPRRLRCKRAGLEEAGGVSRSQSTSLDMKRGEQAYRSGRQTFWAVFVRTRPRNRPLRCCALPD